MLVALFLDALLTDKKPLNLLPETALGSLLNAVIEVTDDTGEIVLEFPFTEAILDFSDIPATRH